MGRFDPVLQEGETKVLINFTVTHSNGSYRTTNHPFKIVFLPTTRVRICEEFPHNLTGLNPVNFRDVLSGVLDDSLLVGTCFYKSQFIFPELVQLLGWYDNTCSKN